MKSLAEHLGVDMTLAGDDTPKTDIETLNGMSAEDFARAILETPEYRRSVLLRINLGELPAQIEALFYHYACGKPIDRLEVTGKVSHAEMTEEQLEARISMLQDDLRNLRDLKEDPQPKSAVH